MAKPTPLFYVFHGNDEFTISETLRDFKRRLGPPETVELNTTVLSGKAATLSELRYACETVPFLAEKRLVIVEGLLSLLSPQKGQALSKAQEEQLNALLAFLPTLPETTRLVFVEGQALPPNHPVLQLAERHARGYAKLFNVPTDKELPAWIQKRVQAHGGTIEGPAAAQLAELIGPELRVLDQEIVKLITYVGPGQTIRAADVAALVPQVREVDVFKLVDALGRRDGKTAAQLLHRLLDQETEHPLGVLAMIVRQFRLLLLVKELKAQGATAPDIAKALQVRDFVVPRLYTQAAHFTDEQLKQVYRQLLETDVAIKTGRIEPEVALDLLVAGLAATE